MAETPDPDHRLGASAAWSPLAAARNAVAAGLGGAGAVLAIGLAVGCGGQGGSPPAACLQGPAAIAQALVRAPAPVTLADGSRLSQCVERARSDGDLQDVGAVLTQAADGLQRRAGAPRGPAGSRAALELGYLIGAVERGGQHTGGVAAELVRRVEQDAGVLDAAPSAVIRALRAGVAAGRATG